MRLNNLTLSISNLWDEFGRVDSPLLGAALNTLFIIAGVLAYEMIGGLIGAAGIVLAILSAIAILLWVMRG